MGERWTTIRDALLARGDGDHVAQLRHELFRLGQLITPELAAFDPDASPFPNLHDAATVSLLQAAELLHHRKLIAVALKSSHAVLSNGPAQQRILAVAELAGEAEKFFRHLAVTSGSDLDHKPTLTHSLVALRTAELLPLSTREQEAWTADEDWVRGERARQRKDKGRKAVPDSKAIPRLWERRVGRRFMDPDFAEDCPRYFAVLEVQRLRNAMAHRQTSQLRQLGLPHATWGRVLGLVTMTCMRAFAAGVLVPAPAAQRGATTILRPPERTEALIAVASVLEPPAPVPPVSPELEALPAIASFVEEVELSRAGKAQASPPSRGLRRLLFVTAAATLAVLAGTLGANRLSPETVATATNDGQAVVPADEALDPQPTDSAPTPSPAPMALLAPPVALGRAPAVPTRASSLSSSPRCRAAQPATDGTLPHLSVEVRGRAPRILPTRAVAKQLGTGNGMGRVMWLAGDDTLGRDRVLAALEAEVCSERPVLSAAEALDSTLPVSARAFVVAVQRPGDSLDLGPLLRGGDEAPSVLIVGLEKPALPGEITVLRAAPLDCGQAESSLYEALDRRPGSGEMQFRRWGLLTGRRETCAPGSLLDDLDGVQVVAASLARHDSAPESVDGSWTGWVAASTSPPTRRAKGGEERLPQAPDGEVALRRAALAAARSADTRGPNPKRRKGCARWSERLFSASEPATTGLVTHLLGLEDGQRCAAWLLAGLEAQGAEPRAILRALDRGLGTHEDRSVTLKRLDGDRSRVRLGREVAGLLEEVE